MRIALLLTLIVSACASPTAVRLHVEYEDAWMLSSLELSARESEQRVSATGDDGVRTRELLVSVPEGWLGQSTTFTVRGYRGAGAAAQLWASGSVDVTPISGRV